MEGPHLLRDLNTVSHPSGSHSRLGRYFFSLAYLRLHGSFVRTTSRVSWWGLSHCHFSVSEMGVTPIWKIFSRTAGLLNKTWCQTFGSWRHLIAWFPESNTSRLKNNFWVADFLSSSARVTSTESSQTREGFNEKNLTFGLSIKPFYVLKGVDLNKTIKKIDLITEPKLKGRGGSAEGQPKAQIWHFFFFEAFPKIS